MIRALSLMAGLVATGASAHTDAAFHLHPHGGESWLAVAGALAVIALAGGLALAAARGRK